MVLATEAVGGKVASRRQHKRRAMVPKPGDLMAPKPATPWAGSALPRSIRNRKPAGVARKAVSPRSPHQEVATNAVTGAGALGPWTGPFGTHPDATELDLPTPIYLDARGAAHLGLEDRDHARLVKALREAQASMGDDGRAAGPLEVAAAAAAAKLAAQLQVVQHEAVRQQRQARMAAHAALDKATVADRRATLLRNHIINQPRRFN